jgi:hypothetical protein
MGLSKKAQTYADACVDGGIVSESQAPYLARNFQMMIDEYEKRIAELEVECHYLRWFHTNADFGPADTDVIMAMQVEYAKDRPVPANWIYE